MVVSLCDSCLQYLLRAALHVCQNLPAAINSADSKATTAPLQDDLDPSSDADAKGAAGAKASSSLAPPKKQVEPPPLHPAIENLDLTGFITGHWDYREKLTELVSICGLATGDDS